ncbi:MAG: chemotaxis response regulator protein-glutamate methylesterase [Deltaproteobacteria bacterium]
MTITAAPSKIKVLVVDDSAFMRRVIKEMLESDRDIDVVGTARDGKEGVEMAASLCPDVITMDIEMPRMNGLEAIEAIMSARPTPILVVSSLTVEGAKSTFEALDKGAADYIPKNLTTSSLDMMKIHDDLVQKVKAVSRKRHKLAGINIFKRQEPAVVSPQRSFVTQKVAVVAIGASTGGPRAIQDVLTKLPKQILTPFIITVHMPKSFTGAFAERLNELTSLEVREARNGDQMKSGQALLCPGGVQTRLKRRGVSDICVELSDEPANSLYKPCVDITMKSVAEVYLGRTLGVILTGMGHDGLEGMRLIKDKGGKTLAQNEETCTVYGMPKAVIDAGVADKVVPLQNIAGEITNMI